MCLSTPISDCMSTTISDYDTCQTPSSIWREQIYPSCWTFPCRWLRPSLVWDAVQSSTWRIGSWFSWPYRICMCVCVFVHAHVCMLYIYIYICLGTCVYLCKCIYACWKIILYLNSCRAHLNFSSSPQNSQSKFSVNVTILAWVFKLLKSTYHAMCRACLNTWRAQKVRECLVNAYTACARQSRVMKKTAFSMHMHKNHNTHQSAPNTSWW